MEKGREGAWKRREESLGGGRMTSRWRESELEVQFFRRNLNNSNMQKIEVCSNKDASFLWRFQMNSEI